MSTTYLQPSVMQLRLGLHVLVCALAVVVALRAVLLAQDLAWTITVAVGAFLTLYIVRVRAASPTTQHVLLLALVAVWVVLVLAGADAAYISVGLFLIFLTELDLRTGLAAIVAVTALDAAVGLVRGGSLGELLGPVLGAALSVLIGLGFRVLFGATERQHALIEELRRTRAELAQSEHAAGQADERQRLAREIHDTVAQSLSSIHLLLHAAEVEPLPATARTRVSLARETAAASLLEARGMIAELAPADLADSSLSAALSRVCERAVTHVRFLIDGDPAPAPMPVQAALVRIAQGALANVEQHAGAHARTVVTLSWSGDRVRLDVVDDGEGFDTAVLDRPHVSTFGLDTTRARVATLGGEFALESEPGHTALSVAFPLQAKETR